MISVLLNLRVRLLSSTNKREIKCCRCEKPIWVSYKIDSVVDNKTLCKTCVKDFGSPGFFMEYINDKKDRLDI